MRSLVLIAGSGRSGTSTLAGVLVRLGLIVPGPPVPPDESNPRGFSEPLQAVQLHQRLLRRADVDVADPRPTAFERVRRLRSDHASSDLLGVWNEAGPPGSGAPDLLVKDPRLLWFLAAWIDAARTHEMAPKVMTMLRPPLDVVGSRQHYYGSRSAVDLLAGWVNTMLFTEAQTRGTPRGFVHYADLLSDWRTPVLGQARVLNLATATSASAERAAAVDEFIDPGLSRIQRTWSDLPGVPSELHRLADGVWEALVALAAAEDREARAQLDALRETYDQEWEKRLGQTRYWRTYRRTPRRVRKKLESLRRSVTRRAAASGTPQR